MSDEDTDMDYEYDYDYDYAERDDDDDSEEERSVSPDHEESPPEAEEGRELNLDDLAASEHPCLEKGRFSVFNHPGVSYLTSKRNLRYALDLDGVVVLSRCLSTFRIGKYGEARFYLPSASSSCPNVYSEISKSRLFNPLPPHLSKFERWLPAFKLINNAISNVRVVFRAKEGASARDLEQLRERQGNLPRMWWESVLIPAIHSLPMQTRTRKLNTTSTFLETSILPRYLRLYKEDIVALDHALANANATQASSICNDLEYYFSCWQLGQRHELEPGDDLDPEAFGLEEIFDTSICCRFSAHLGFNLQTADPAYSLFWDSQRIFDWTTQSSSTDRKRRLHLFGLTELGCLYVGNPINSSLEEAVGGHNIVFLQHYTPMVKAMEQKVPLKSKPHLLTYILGTRYVSSTVKMAELWKEVDTERTRLELEEIANPDLQIDARFEVVITENDSFLSHFDHRLVSKRLVEDRLLVQIPKEQFAGYVRSTISELYGSIRAALKGTLTGEGTLGTVLLCETLIGYLSTGQQKDQPYKVLAAYNPLVGAVHRRSRRVDLSEIATTSGDVLYVPRPAVERVWVPFSFLSSVSARRTAAQVIEFLNTLQDYVKHHSSVRPRMVAQAADLIVLRFKEDLLELGAVHGDIRRLDGDILDGCVKDVMTAEQYIDRVFVKANLPEDMSCRNLLAMARDLMDPRDLRKNLISKLLQRVKMVPKTTVHARSVQFSSSDYTLLLGSHLSSVGMTDDDIHRLVVASAPLLERYFNFNKRLKRKMLMRRPTLHRCVRGAIRFVRRRTRSTRKLLAVTCVTAVVLAEKEKLLQRKVNLQRLYRGTNLSRSIRRTDIEVIVRQSMAGHEYGLPDCLIVLDNRLIVRS